MPGNASSTGRPDWRGPLVWRSALVGLCLAWWHVLALYVLSGRTWRASDGLALWPGGVDAVPDQPWQSVVLAVTLAAALFGPWLLPKNGLRPPPGPRTWMAAGLMVGLVPQLWMAAFWLAFPVLEPARTAVGQPTRPMLWIIAESADVGVSLPRIDARRHDYYSVRYSSSVPAGPIAGVWAQICGARLDWRRPEPRHGCLVDERWRIVHGADSPRVDMLLASTGAAVVAIRRSEGPPQGASLDAALLRAALSPDRMRHHVLVLTADTEGAVDAVSLAASDAAMDAAVGAWLERGGVALVTANRPRSHGGWSALPARLYGVDELALPASSDVAFRLGRAAPGRLMGGLPQGSLYDVGCTAWQLAGFGCSRLGHGVSVTEERSRTLAPFRPGG